MKLTNDIPALLMLIAACILATCGGLRLIDNIDRRADEVQATIDAVYAQRAYSDSLKLAIALHDSLQRGQYRALMVRAGIK